MKTQGLGCRVCGGAIAIRAVDRERGWVECRYCTNVRRIGAALPVESEQSPDNRMLWVHKGGRDDIVIRPLGGPRWLYPAVVWLAVLLFGTALVGGGPRAITLTVIALLAAAAYLVWRRLEARLTFEHGRLEFSRFLGGRRLWGWQLDLAHGVALELVGLGMTPKLAVTGEHSHRIMVHLRTDDEWRWLEQAFQRATTPNEVLGATTCTNCAAELEVTPRIKEREAFNCDYCGIGLVFRGANARAVQIALCARIDLDDVVDLFPDDAGVLSRGTTSEGTQWLIYHPTAHIAAALAFLVGGGFSAYFIVRALQIMTWSAAAPLSFYAWGWAAFATLAIGGMCWSVIAPDYGTLRVTITDRLLVLEKSMCGQLVSHHELPLVSLWNVEVRVDSQVRLVLLTVNTCFRSVGVTWKLDDIDAARVTRELFAELQRRLRALDRESVVLRARS